MLTIDAQIVQNAGFWYKPLSHALNYSGPTLGFCFCEEFAMSEAPASTLDTKLQKKHAVQLARRSFISVSRYRVGDRIIAAIRTLYSSEQTLS